VSCFSKNVVLKWRLAFYQTVSKGERIKELIEGRNCELVYLPPYSPGLLRKVEARTREAVVEAIGAAIVAITASDARGFFDHCG
jgi:transposase